MRALPGNPCPWLTGRHETDQFATGLPVIDLVQAFDEVCAFKQNRELLQAGTIRPIVDSNQARCSHDTVGAGQSKTAANECLELFAQ